MADEHHVTATVYRAHLLRWWLVCHLPFLHNALDRYWPTVTYDDFTIGPRR
ncbi:MAG: hypothetical protein M3O87_01905 [Candidatus Dormibacteraeota bacterium]|nr:hypothetical protein [Candidatus Dormibacteraeota bacterium]